MYVEMQRIMNNEGSAIIPFFANYVEAATSKLKKAASRCNSSMSFGVLFRFGWK
jgi:hypothetical protein